MPTRVLSPIEAMKKTVLAIEADYSAYLDRSEMACMIADPFQLLDYKVLPAKAANEMRNAFDHFIRVSRRILAPTFRQRTRRKANKGEVQQIGVELDVARCRKHIVAAQFYCVRYSITRSVQESRALLKQVPRGKDSQVDRCRSRLKEIIGGRKSVRAPS